MAELPSRARVVIIGGGVIGTSVAYHLTRLGWTDVLLLEQGSLSCGTTWHAAGLVGPLRASESGTRLVQYSAELYARLEEETGQATGYKQVGGVIVARTEDRMVQLRRTAANAAAYDMECALLTPDEALEKWPVMAVDDLLGALWLPGDGKVNPTDLTMALARGARAGGARIVERARVLETLVADGPAGPRVTGVRTESGVVEAEVVVNCGGQWAKALAEPLGVTVPLHSAEHFYVVTDGIDGVHPDLPLLRDPDGWTYFKEEVGGLVVGGFEPEAKPWRSPDDLPHPFEFQLLEEDWEHFSVLMDEAVRRVPALAETGIRKFYNGPESFTPGQPVRDGRGARAWAATSSAPASTPSGSPRPAARAGRWRSGSSRARRPPTWSPSTSSASRASTATTGGCGRGWRRCSGCTTRCRGRTARWRPPGRSAARRCTTGWRRGVRRTARRWAGSGPTTSRRPAHRPTLAYSWGKPPWLDWSAAEQRATREAVAVFDQTSFSKYVVDGPGALEGLQWVCANDVDVPLGRAVYTPLLDERGRYQSDLTVTRVGGVRVPAGQQLGDHGPRPGLDPAAPAGRLRRPGPRRHHVVRRARGDGAAVPGAAGAADRRRPLGGRRSRSRPAGRSRSATRSCAPPG